MNKKGKVELVEELVALSTEQAEETGGKKLTKKASSELVDLFTQAVKNLVAEEGDVLTLQNFLRIEKYKSPATNRRNPQTGETIAVPEKVRTKAKANF